VAGRITELIRDEGKVGQVQRSVMMWAEGRISQAENRLRRGIKGRNGSERKVRRGKEQKLERKEVTIRGRTYNMS
jgi:hypothetical protein